MTDLESSGRRSHEAAGFSTLAMIVSLALLGFLLSPILGSVMSAQRGFVANRQKARAASSVRYAHLALTRLMRIAGSSPVGSPIQAIDPDPLAVGAFNNIRLRADYNPPDGDVDDPGEDLEFYLRGDTMFVRPGGAEEEPYIIGVDSLSFEYFDRDGAVITDPDRVLTRAISAQVMIRARGESTGDATERMLVGHVRLRNGR